MILGHRLSSHAWLLVLVVIGFSVPACGAFNDPAGNPTLTDVPKPTLAPSTVTAQPVAQSTATTTNKVSGIIKSVTMALETNGDGRDPVNPTIVFSSNSVFHAVIAIENAPANTRFRATWYATDVGSVADRNTLIDSAELTSDASRNLDFTLAPKAAWPIGTYRVEIAVNGNMERVVDFSVGATPPTPTAMPAKPSGYISGVTMAQRTRGVDNDPVNPGTVFQTKSIFHAIVATKNAPKNSKLTATWYAVDVGSAAEPNTKLRSTDLTTDGTRNIDFTLSPSTTWPVGIYQVDILFSDVLDQSVTFTVK